MKKSPDYPSPEVLDLLPTFPSNRSFEERVADLELSPLLLSKLVEYSSRSFLSRDWSKICNICISVNDEKELGGEILLRRHRFTELLFQSSFCKQAALTVVQNIYLFQKRHIFFAPEGLSLEAERQKALTLFSTPQIKNIPLSSTLQHLVIARIWHRITSQLTQKQLNDPIFLSLHQIIEELNTLRNIYVLLSTRLISYLTGKIASTFRQSLSHEDAVQIGFFGVARAAYRYHHSCGVRFSTFSAKWIFREVQRQALSGRLIRLSSNIFDQLSRATRRGDNDSQRTIIATLEKATPLQIFDLETERSLTCSVAGDALLERKELSNILLQLIDKLLTPINAEIIKRRFGLPPFHDKEESIVEIAKRFGRSRSSIYQREKVALALLRRHLPDEFLPNHVTDEELT